MNAVDRNVSGSSRNELIPMIVSRCLASMPTVLENALNTIATSTAVMVSTSSPVMPPA